METDQIEQLLVRVRHIEDLTEKTHRSLRMMILWRNIYLGLLVLIVVSGYIYLGPTLDMILKELKTLISVVGS